MVALNKTRIVIGPLALPGKYKVRLSADSWNQTQPLGVALDPRLATAAVTYPQLLLIDQLVVCLEWLAAPTEKSDVARRDTLRF